MLGNARQNLPKSRYCTSPGILEYISPSSLPATHCIKPSSLEGRFKCSCSHASHMQPAPPSHPQSFVPLPNDPFSLCLSSTYPLATGLHPIPPTSGTGKGNFLSELVKNTGCLVAASYALFAGADNDIGGVRLGGMASIWFLGLEF